MSETMVAFGGPVAHLVASSQAIVAVANNPADFASTTELTALRPARALFGHPGFGRLTRGVQPADGAPGVALLHERTGEVRWLPVTSTHPNPPPSDERRTDLAMPLWAAELTRQIGSSLRRRASQPARVTFRTAAVLVLLTDSAEGPAVLLTERSQDLTDYPGQLVFPGGAAEPADDGPVMTALREAAEETGLDPSSVRILGLLTALALPDSGFLLTPVLAGSPRPAFTGPCCSTRPTEGCRSSGEVIQSGHHAGFGVIGIVAVDHPSARVVSSQVNIQTHYAILHAPATSESVSTPCTNRC